MATSSSKVNALIIGTQKGGTTALFEFLAMHPQISTPVGEKELHFFDSETEFAKEQPDYRAYEARFEASDRRAVRLEATPIYMWWMPAAPRIAAYNPGMKLIMILRDPVERAISQWEMEYSRGTETNPCQAAFAEELANLRGSGEQHRIRSYIARGFYAAQIRRLLRYFPLGQLLFLKREDLLNDHERTLNRCYDFLEIKRPASYPAMRMVYPTEKTGGLTTIETDAKKALRRFFLADLQDLASLTGLDVDAWRIA